MLSCHVKKRDAVYDTVYTKVAVAAHWGALPLEEPPPTTEPGIAYLVLTDFDDHFCYLRQLVVSYGNKKRGLFHMQTANGLPPGYTHSRNFLNLSPHTKIHYLKVKTCLSRTKLGQRLATE